MVSIVQAAVVCAALAWWIYKRNSAPPRDPKFEGVPRPPGPKGLPFIGSAHKMPRKKEWEGFSELSKKYGHFLWLQVFGRGVIIVDSFEAALELTEKRGAIYSSRPRLMMAGKLMGFDQTLPLMPYDDNLREARKITHRTLSARPIKQFIHVCEDEAGRFLRRILDTPAEWEQHIREVSGATTMKVLYGYQAGGKMDPLVHLFETALHAFSLAAAPGAYMVDFFPSLMWIPDWLPGGRWKKDALTGRKPLLHSMHAGYQFTQRAVAAGTAQPSLMQDAFTIAEEAKDPEEKRRIINLAKWTATALGGAGADTPVSSLLFWVLAMVANPEAQAKARAELDTVIGRGRLPTLEDRPNLPYVNALIKEVLRWFPVAPMGVPHTASCDDEYEGMFVPKGTSLILNQFAMLHNPKYFPEPEKFKPERFLGENPADSERAGNPYAIAFGFGRRICPGMHLGDAMLFCVITKTLSTFTIERPIDEKTGLEYDPPVDCTSGNVSFPVHFTCRFVPRGEEAKDVIRRDTEELVAGDGLPKNLTVPESIAASYLPAAAL